MMVYLKHTKIGNNHLDSLSSDDIEVDSDTGGIPILEELGLVSQRYDRCDQSRNCNWLLAQNAITSWSYRIFEYILFEKLLPFPPSRLVISQTLHWSSPLLATCEKA